MAIHPGMKTIRTPRTRALELGTTKEGFGQDTPICSQCGEMLTTGMAHAPHGHYAENIPPMVDKQNNFQKKPF
jgi:hypothetical protein